MNQILVLDNTTIDKIAAGEVVERPVSVVKELVENAIDAGATAITVEIKEGGLSLIRITDNGSGIAEDQVHKAFLRHATSKIRNEKDLTRINSLGFRGEALSSIAAVSQVEMMTRRKDTLMGVHYCISGGEEISSQPAGVPEGTTILVKNIFYNTPARLKFLKSAATEGGYIADLCERIAMGNPAISFRFIANGQIRFHTSGNDDLREIIYRIYGKTFLEELLPITVTDRGMSMKGFLGKPSLNRSNRNFENCFVNGRYVKSTLLYKAVEEGYRPYLMQHKFPFVVLFFEFDPLLLDVNVHPTKMDIRITDSPYYLQRIAEEIGKVLGRKELIPSMEKEIGKASPLPAPEPVKREEIPEPFEVKQLEKYRVQESFVYDGGEQLDLFEEKIVSPVNRHSFEILGQVFDTYWLIAYEDQLLFVDQHSAHEKVKFEKLMAQAGRGDINTQLLRPPLVLQVTQKEEAVLKEYRDYFTSLGFEWDDFGHHSIALRMIPMDLYGKNEAELFLEILDELAEDGSKGTPDVIREKIISMACKAAVKGNQSISRPEMAALLEQMLELENPYHCPHGRPTIISMSKKDMEKKFKRIV